MNHCKSCGQRVSRGRTDAHASNHKQAYNCLLCIQARVMKGWRYVSPSMKRWAKKKGERG